MNNLPSLAPRTFQEAREFAVTLSKSNFCPKDYKDKPDDILIAAQMGGEIGLGFMQSVQNIAVINSRPCVWGDAMLALVQASGLLKFHKEYFDANDTAVCEVARKGDVDEQGKQVIHVVRFSNKDRDTAKLTNKGVHETYPQRMKQMRARGFALRDKFADVLKGLIAREEAIDITPLDDVHVEQHPMGELSEDETPRAAEHVELVMDEKPDQEVEWITDEQPAEVEESQPNLPCTDAEKESFKAYVASIPKPREEKMAVLRTVPGWTIVKNMTKGQMEAAMKKLGEMK